MNNLGNILDINQLDSLFSNFLEVSFLEAFIKISLIILFSFLIVYLSKMFTDKFRKMLEKSALTSDERLHLRATTISNIINNCIIVVVCLVAFILALGELGINIGPILAGAGVLGLAVSFGAQSLVKDIITGFFILLEDQYGIGDVIQIDKFSGTVENMNLRTTILRDLSGNVHIIPNGQISQVTVMTKCWSRALVDIQVFYKQDIQRIIAIISEEANKLAVEWSDRIIENPEILGINSIDSNGVTIRVIIKTKSAQQWSVERELRKRVIDRFNELGIDLPFFSALDYPMELK